MIKKRAIRIAICVTLCLLVGLMAAVATQSSVHDWYTSLHKPVFNPPNWIFAPVWSILYVMMGVAAGMVWNKGFYHKWVKTALYHLGIQIIINAFWSVIFFGLKLPLAALFVIMALFIVLLPTYKWFRLVDRKAAYLLLPCLLWVAFAAVLNFEVWRLN